MAPTLSASERVELVASFEDATIDNCNFSHTEHLYVIWSLVKSRGTLGAVSRFASCLKRITEAEGHQEKYHATVTHALGILVGERVAAAPDLDWEGFVETNQDLFEWPNGLLNSMYPEGALDSPEAKASFVLPPT